MQPYAVSFAVDDRHERSCRKCQKEARISAREKMGVGKAAILNAVHCTERYSTVMCEILSVSTKTGYKLLKEGKICCLKVGRAYRIPKAHLFTYLCIGNQIPPAAQEA